MDIQYGKPAQSVKRFSRFKWVTAAVLLALLLLVWFSGASRVADPPADGAGPGAASASATSLAIERAGDGGLRVRGTVPDEATRNQWLNAIRIGAQGARVTDDVRIDAVTPATGWAGQLSGLVAVMRERKLAGLSVEGDKVALNGEVGTQADKAEVEKMVRAQLPSGYSLDSRLAVAGAVAGGGSAGGGSAGGASPGGPAVTSAANVPPAPPSSGASSSPSSASTDSSGPSSSMPSAAAPGTRSAGSSAAAAPKADADGSTRVDPAAQENRQSSKTAARKPANCPRQIRSLAQSVYFKTDASSISPEDRARLEQLGGCLGRARLRIVGHADPRHTDEYNLELSQRRARTVADALAAGGAPPSRIAVVAAGKTKSSAKGASRQALQRSRRVDIQIR